MHFLLICALAVVYPLLHIFNAYAFKFAEISPHIGLIYLPAFLRLFNVMVLGAGAGTLATMLGGVLLMWYFNDSTLVGLLNIACSAGGPLVAIFLFRIYFHRNYELTSLKDLTTIALIYAPANALLHHLMWSQLDPTQLASPIQVLQMTFGDIFGALIGAYAMGFCMKWYERSRIDI